MESNTKVFPNDNTKVFSEKPIVDYSGGRDRWHNLIGVRILRPWELKRLITIIPKKYHRINFEFLFYTGMRYMEALAVKTRKDLFFGDSIQLTPDLITKPKCKVKSRYIKLNPVGQKVAEEYFDSKEELPKHWNAWRDNLRRWATKAEIDSQYLSVKTTRKTLESYLITIYPEKSIDIFVSQGHTEMTALKNYVNLPFSDENKKNMVKYVAGWG